MKKQNGMRPLDIVVLLKIAAIGPEEWQGKNLAQSLILSASEVSVSLRRSEYARLYNYENRTVFRQSLIEFLIYGLKYVFPQQPGAITVGMPTSHAAPVLADKFISETPFVWPDPDGTVRGQSIEPLYSTVPAACRLDKRLYNLLALTDALRTGGARIGREATEQLSYFLKLYADAPAITELSSH